MPQNVEMPSNTVILDGLTVQQAAELLFQRVPADQLRTCRETYIRSLEDFAFAIMFGEKFALTGKPSKMGDDDIPGLLVTQRFSDAFVAIDKSTTLEPEDILADEYYRPLIEADISRLFHAFQQAGYFWRDWIQREARACLGRDLSLFADDDQSGHFVFDRKPKDYLKDNALQQVIPREFVSELVNAISAEPCSKNVRKAALIEFVERNALQLVTILWWYDCVSTTLALRGGVRCPNVVRAQIIQLRPPVQPDQLRLVPLDRTGGEHWVYAKRVLTRHALAHALQNVRSRAELVENLSVLRDLQPYPRIRKILADYWTEFNNEGERRDAKLSKIITCLERLTSDGNPLTDGVVLEANFKHLSVKGHLSTIMDSICPTLRYLRQLVTRGQDYEARLAPVFPELELEH